MTKIYAALTTILLLGSGCPGAGEPRLEIRERTRLEDISSSAISYHVVSLKNAQQRRKAISVQFEAMNQVTFAINQVAKSEKQEPVSHDFIDALLGRDLDKQALAREGYYELDSLKDGELGLFRTTTQIILPMAAASKDNSLFVVLEDDVVLAADLDFSFRQALKWVPADWDILYLGCFQNALLGENDQVLSPFHPPQMAHDKGKGNNLCPTSAATRIFGTSFVKLDNHCTPGTWAYTLSNRSAKKVSELLKDMMPLNRPIDEAYRILIGGDKLNVYCLNPELVRPHYALPSTIR